jgi:DNA polymerase-3 subunit alpha
VEFVHLHVHSQYSMLDGAIRVKDLVRRVAAGGMGAVALTDHANMFGAITLYKAAKEAGIKAILGCELDVLQGGRMRHLPLLSTSLDGYKNLVHLVSMGHVTPPADAAPGHPCISLDTLAGHTKGLVGLTGCMGGLVAQSILEQGEQAGRKTLARLKDLFEPGHLFVELQDHGLVEQPVLNRILVDLARDLDLPIVATNDVHYAERTDAPAQMLLGCIKTGRTMDEARERSHGSEEMYLKSPLEMAQLFGDLPEALRNTLRIAEMCELRLNLGEPMLPTFPIPEGYDLEGYFRHLAREGLQRRFQELDAQGRDYDRTKYENRLEMELGVICQMKFPGYFLIVWDFIRYAKEHGVPVGPGRGSGAGSIVAWSLRITELDPIRYNLLFERFLNPERVSMPDFDIDFCMDRRDRVIQYVQHKYGESSVGQIATFAELKAKSVVKDVARAMGISAQEAQQLANLIPRKTPAETYTIQEALTIEPKLKQRYDAEPRIKELLDLGSRIEGMTRHAGKHAAGIVISDGPLWAHVPIFRDDKSGAYVTQYHKDDVEAAGLVKFDFLGLKTLTVLDIAVRLINARPDVQAAGNKLDLASIPLDDKATFALLASGETKGVFQLESSGMQQLFKDLRADCFEDIVAAVALYRPGPLGSGMVADFVARKHGRQPIAKMHELVDHLLEPTYGVIVYQEQVMQIAQALAGYTLGGADLLRRAMGKKKPEEMAKQKSIFIEGAKKKGVDEADAERIFGLLEYFAGYGFNKSHSAAYALLTYQTAYLKAHFPVEMLCAIMTSDKDRIDKVVRTIADARTLGATVLPPDINESDTDFKVVYAGHPLGKRRGRVRENMPVVPSDDPMGPQIRFGLGAVRGLGGAALEAVLEARAHGPFRDLFDFAARVDAKRVNKAVLESLIACGAFDKTVDPSAARETYAVTRARAYASIDIALERSRAASRDREVGQTSLFGLLDAAAASSGNRGSSQGTYVDCPPWDSRELLARERQALGFYVSGHPLDRYLKGSTLARLDVKNASDMAQQDDWAVVKLAGMVEGYRERIFKDGGGKIAFFDLEDLTGRVTVKVRGSAIDAYANVLTSGEPVLITGKVSFPRRDDDVPEDEMEGPREPTLLLNEVRLLADVIRQDVKQLVLKLDADRIDEKKLQRVKDLLTSSRGDCQVIIQLTLSGGREATLALGRAFCVELGDELFAGLERLFGEQVAELR